MIGKVGLSQQEIPKPFNAFQRTFIAYLVCANQRGRNRSKIKRSICPQGAHCSAKKLAEKEVTGKCTLIVMLA